jgi:hypothetical protein
VVIISIKKTAIHKFCQHLTYCTVEPTFKSINTKRNCDTNIKKIPSLGKEYEKEKGKNYTSPSELPSHLQYTFQTINFYKCTLLNYKGIAMPLSVRINMPLYPHQIYKNTTTLASKKNPYFF